MSLNIFRFAARTSFFGLALLLPIFAQIDAGEGPGSFRHDSRQYASRIHGSPR